MKVKRAIVYFLHKQKGWIILFLLQFFLVFAYYLLAASFYLSARELLLTEWSYTLLLSVILLISFLAIQFFRFYPGFQQLEQIRNTRSLDQLAARLSPAMKREINREIVERILQIAMTERQEYINAHQQHLEYMNLWVHQMKTPLSSLLLLVNKMSRLPDQDELIEQQKSMAEELDRLRDGLDQVLQMTRLSGFSLDYQIKPVDLVEDIRSIIHQKKREFIRRGVFPKMQIDQTENWRVLTDSKWNRFVIEQIVQNALKYASQLKESSYLTFDLTRESRQIVLSITDQGPGIPAQDLPRIFDPFFTGENGRRYPGATGMGLPLVKKVCTALGQQVKVESTEGKGTTVSIFYPLQD
jgi:OmpR family two-component system sensor histidine kinase YxdK